jgi:DDE superfamily endonuclease
VAAPLSVLPSGLPAYPDHPAALARLRGFRAGLYACCLRRAAGLLDLADALLSAPGPIASLPHLSLEPAHRRGWGSTYAALARGRIDAERLRGLLAGYPLAGGQPIYAVDVTTWPRCDAECSPERGLYYHPSRHSAGQPIIAGWAFQWICQLSFDRDCWTAPLDAARLHPLDDTDRAAAGQIRALMARLSASDPNQQPLFVFDAGYNSAQLSVDLAGLPLAVLVRLRADRCFYADPPPRPPGATGRPRRHGAKFAFADPTTWPVPTASHTAIDEQYGTVTVTAWAGLHPKQHNHPGKGTRAPRPIVRGTVLRVQVQRIPARTRPPKVLWLWWPAPAGLTWTLPGGPTPADSTWSTPSASPNRPWGGPPRGCARPPRPSGGPGWCWPATPNCAWPATPWPTNGWHGSGPGRPASCRPTGSVEGFRACCVRWDRPLTRQNPQAAHPAGPRAAAPARHLATQPSKRPPDQPAPAPTRSPMRSAATWARPQG